MPASDIRDGRAIEETARELLRSLGAARIAGELRVEWNSRLKTSAGRADYRQKLISLNPRLSEYPTEIDRTLRHELAHILAQFRAGRRRIPPHGGEWRKACWTWESPTRSGVTICRSLRELTPRGSSIAVRIVVRSFRESAARAAQSPVLPAAENIMAVIRCAFSATAGDSVFSGVCVKRRISITGAWHKRLYKWESPPFAAFSPRNFA